MLKGKQRAYLRSIANTLKPSTQIGKDGVTESFLDQLDDMLRKREIVKVTILETAMAMVEIISPSSLLDFTSARSIASMAQGSLRFEILPVTKERYVPPAPSMGT